MRVGCSLTGEMGVSVLAGIRGGGGDPAIVQLIYSACPVKSSTRFLPQQLTAAIFWFSLISTVAVFWFSLRNGRRGDRGSKVGGRLL